MSRKREPETDTKPPFSAQQVRSWWEGAILPAPAPGSESYGPHLQLISRTGVWQEYQRNAYFLLHLTLLHTPLSQHLQLGLKPCYPVTLRTPDKRDQNTPKLRSCTAEHNEQFDSIHEIKHHFAASWFRWYWIRVQKNIINVLLQGNPR